MKGHYFAEETLVALGRAGQPREVSLRGECSFKLKTTHGPIIFSGQRCERQSAPSRDAASCAKETKEAQPLIPEG